MTKTYLILCLWMLVALPSCSGLRDAARMTEPDIRLQGVHLARFGLDGVDLAFDIALQNPNPVPVSLEAIQYDLFLEGERFISGRQDQAHDIQALDDTRIELPLRLDFGDLRRTYAALEEQDSTSYELRARLTFQIPVLGFRSLGLKHDGRVPVVRPPRISVAGIRLQDLSPNSADVAVQLSVHNPNAFGLGLQQLEYALAVNGDSWATGRSEQLVQVEAGDTQAVALPLSVNLSQLGLGVYSQLLQLKPVDYHFTGDVELTTGLSVLPSARVPLDLSGRIDLTR